MVIRDDAIEGSDILYIDMTYHPSALVGQCGMVDGKLSVAILAVATGEEKDYLSLAIQRIKAKFAFQPKYCLISEISETAHHQVSRVYPDIIIKVPVYFVIRWITVKSKIGTNAIKLLIDWFELQGIYGRDGTTPFDAPPAQSIQPSVDWAKQIRHLWSHFGMNTFAPEEMWSLLWTNEPHADHTAFWFQIFKKEQVPSTTSIRDAS